MKQIIFIEDNQADIEEYKSACFDFRYHEIIYFDKTDKPTKDYIKNQCNKIDIIFLDIICRGDGNNYMGGYSEGINFYANFLKPDFPEIHVLFFTNKIEEKYIKDLEEYGIEKEDVKILEKNNTSIKELKEQIKVIINNYV